MSVYVCVVSTWLTAGLALFRLQRDDQLLGRGQGMAGADRGHLDPSSSAAAASRHQHSCEYSDPSSLTLL